MISHVLSIIQRGITLSGGQKARVSLARAAYRRNVADIYLLGELPYCELP
jgi:ABC-type transport system involved in cytochrome bd biosynthesis fused ATPase/permease subunit